MSSEMIKKELDKEDKSKANNKFNTDGFSQCPSWEESHGGAVTHAQEGSFNWQDNRQTWDHGLLPLLINVPNAPSTNCQNKSSFPLTFADRW